MERLRLLYKRLLHKLCWSMLRAAEFDALASELIDITKPLRDPTAFIPRRMAELEGADNRLESRILRLEGVIAQLRNRVEVLEDANAAP